ncbi:MAG: PRC-barrel domain-containing protein [Candidatus Saccharimonadales bacterium]
MLLLSKDLINKKVLSLRTNSPIADIVSPIINPNNLKVEGFYCSNKYDKKSQLVLLHQDIREVLPAGYIVNDHDVLTPVEDLIRLKEILDINFNPIGKQVETISGDKVGKVSDYAGEVESMYIQKLYVSQPIYKNISGGSLIVDRSQINEITPRRIIINDLLGTVPAEARASII